MLIAVASSQGIKVDRHFGNTDIFYLFTVERNNLKPAGSITVIPYSSGSKDHLFDEEKFGEISDLLSGCSRLYCNKIGEKPREELLKKRIEPVEYTGLISGIPL